MSCFKTGIKTGDHSNICYLDKFFTLFCIRLSQGRGQGSRGVGWGAIALSFPLLEGAPWGTAPFRVAGIPTLHPQTQADVVTGFLCEAELLHDD